MKTPIRARPGIRRYPIWSIKSITIVSLIVVAIVSAVVFGIGKQSILVEAEWIVVIVSSCLFLFLLFGLYRGVRVRKREPAPGGFEFINVEPSDIGLDAASGLGDVIGAADDLPGLILAPILFVVFGILLIFLLPIVVNVAWLLLFVFVLMLFWVFRAALRQVFVRSRQTRGRVIPSLGYAGWYTMLYSGWLIAVLVLARSMA